MCAVRVQLSLDIQTDNQLLHRLVATLLVAAIGGAVVVWLGGFSLVNLGLAPVRRLAGQTRALSADKCTTGSMAASSLLSLCR